MSDDGITKFIFHEHIFVYDYNSDAWIPKQLICFNYKNVDPNILSEKSFSRSSRNTYEEASKLLIEVALEFPEVIQSDMYLNHLYEIHHYDRKRFLESSHLTHTRKPRDTPKYIISITVEEEELRNNGLYFTKDSFFKASEFDPHFSEEKKEDEPEHRENLTKGIYLGCNFDRTESKTTWEELIAGLSKEFRYSGPGLFDQMQIRFSKLILKCFKDLLRFLMKVSGEEEQATSLHAVFYFVKKKLRLQNFRDCCSDLNLELEIQNVVYKCLISEGLFPIFIDLNTMNAGWIDSVKQFIFNKMCCVFFTNEEILPWSTKFHASITILDRYYSYTPNNLMNQRSDKDRIFQENFDYYRIKVLDFFPLDEWVTRISDFFINNFDLVFDEISVIFDFNKILSHYDPLDELSRPENSFDDDKLSGPSVSSKPLLKPKEKKNVEKKKDIEIWLDYDLYKKRKKDSKDIVYLVLIKRMNSLKESSVDQITKRTETLPRNLANNFMSNYSYELLGTSFFNNFCTLIAKTEMKKYDFLKQNCQTIVAEVVHDLHEQFKRYIDILLPLKDMMQAPDEKLEKYYMKFPSYLCNFKYFKNFGFIEPCFFNARLDYYGIYVDKYLKKKIEKWIKDSEIKSKHNKRIEKIQAEFNKNLKTLFKKDTMQDPFLNMQEKNNITIRNKSFHHNSLNRRPSSDTNRHIGEKLELVSDCLSSLLFNTQIESLEIRKKIISYKLHKNGKNTAEAKMRELNKIKYENRVLHREFSYYYFNAVRLQNSFNENKNYFSYIGFILIKNPEELLSTEPENFKKNYELF